MSGLLDWANLKRLLVVRLDNLGDVVMLAPALRSIRGAAPSVHITLLASPGGVEAAGLLRDVDDVVAYRAPWQQLSPGASSPALDLALIDRLRRQAFSAAIIFTSFSQDPGAPAFACYLAGIPQRAGWAPLFSGELLTHPVSPPRADGHQAERDLELVAALGAPVRTTAIELDVPGSASDLASTLLERFDLPAGKYVALVPGASAPARRYPAERFGQAALELAADPGLPSLVIGEERDRALAETIVAIAGPAARSVVGRTDVATAAALIARAALVITNNSLAMHLADAFGVPVVVTYAGTDLESQWAPRSTATRVLRRATSCAPCYLIDCDRQLRCLDFPPSEVAAAARSITRSLEPAA